MSSNYLQNYNPQRKEETRRFILFELCALHGFDAVLGALNVKCPTYIERNMMRCREDHQWLSHINLNELREAVLSDEEARTFLNTDHIVSYSEDAIAVAVGDEHLRSVIFDMFVQWPIDQLQKPHVRKLLRQLAMLFILYWIINSSYKEASRLFGVFLSGLTRAFKNLLQKLKIIAADLPRQIIAYIESKATTSPSLIELITGEKDEDQNNNVNLTADNEEFMTPFEQARAAADQMFRILGGFTNMISPPRGRR